MSHTPHPIPPPRRPPHPRAAAVGRTDPAEARRPDQPEALRFEPQPNGRMVYLATDPALVREHARRAGFPANRVSEIRAGIDPTTAEPALVAARD